MSERQRSVSERSSHGVYKGLEVIELYEQAFTVIYRRVQSYPRWHGRLRDTTLDRVCAFAGHLYTASKTNQISKIYDADARLAEIRYLLRVAAHNDIKAINADQLQAIQNLLYPVGARLHEWQDAVRNKKRTEA